MVVCSHLNLRSELYCLNTAGNQMKLYEIKVQYSQHIQVNGSQPVAHKINLSGRQIKRLYRKDKFLVDIVKMWDVKS